MKIQNTPKLQKLNSNQTPSTENSNNPSFKGAEWITSGLNFIQTNQAVGATLVDAGCMCTPRTIVDFTRSPEAGIETARREFSSNINDALMGIYGMGAALLLSKVLGSKSKYGVDTNKMFVDNKRLDVLAAMKGDKTLGSNEQHLKEYLTEIFDNARAFNPNIEGCDKKGWVKIDSTTQDELVNEISEKLKQEVIDKKEIKYDDLKMLLKSKLMRATGTEGDFKLEKIIKTGGKEELVSSTSSVTDFVDDVYKVTKSFMSSKVENASGDFVQHVKKLNKGTALLGIAACAGIGAAVQPINMYLTKKKTGKSGFVGGGSEDKTVGFTALKIGVALAATVAALASISRKPSELMSKIQFKGPLPTLNQFKIVYGITIVSRLLSARNKNELRESSIKDSLGFANWLIVGGFVSKAVAMLLERIMKKSGEKFTKFNQDESTEIIKRVGKPDKIKKSWKLFACNTLSREEVLHDALKKAGISVTSGKKALSVKEMMVALNNIKSEALIPLKKATKAKLRYLTLIQFAGYAWSALALGVAVPKLNIAITNAVEGKRKQTQAVSK